jgi:hypothetical protein
MSKSYGLCIAFIEQKSGHIALHKVQEKDLH